MRKLFIIGLCVFISISASCAFAKSDKSKDSESSKTNHSESSKATSAPDEHRGNLSSHDRGSAPSSTSTTSYRPASVPSAIATPSPSASRPSRDESRPSYRPMPTPSAPTTPVSTDRQPRHGNIYTGERDTTPTTPRPDHGTASYRPTPTPSAPEAPVSTDRQQRHGNIYTGERDTTPTTPRPDHGATSYRPTPTPSAPAAPVSGDRQQRHGNIYTGERDTTPTTPRQDHGTVSYRPTPGATSDNRDHTSYNPKSRDTKPVPAYTPTRDTTSYSPHRDDSRDRRPDSGYHPSGSSYTVGYHPSRDGATVKHTVLRYSPPKGYRPPAYREGRYYYAAPRVQRPCNYGYWAFDYYPEFSRRSVYYHFGLYPYIQINRIVIEDSYPTVTYVQTPIYISGGNVDSTYAISKIRGLDETLGDIRSAWISGRYDLIERHVQQDRDIAVFLEGSYDYSITSQDYLAMTNDAIGGMDTVRFVWTKVRQRSDGSVTAYGSHTYRTSGKSRVVYVSYTLERIDHEYYITEVGSSAK